MKTSNKKNDMQKKKRMRKLTTWKMREKSKEWKKVKLVYLPMKQVSDPIFFHYELTIR